MTRDRRIVVAAAASFVGGAVLALGLAYLWFRPVSDFFGTMPFQSAASDGKLHVKLLRYLNTGDYAKAKSLLELVLDGNITTLAGYADAVRPGDGDPGIYQAAQIIRDYRLEYPSVTADPDVQEELRKGLSLAQYAKTAERPNNSLDGSHGGS